MNRTEHMLSCVAEECAEIIEQCSRVAVRASKAMRFGISEVQPGQDRTNAERLAAELGELIALAEMMEDAGFITRHNVQTKKRKVLEFMDYARTCGSLEG